MNLALPMTFPIGIVPDAGSPVHRMPCCRSAERLVQCARESAECVRLSPITHSRPSGTVTGPNSGLGGLSQLISPLLQGAG